MVNCDDSKFRLRGLSKDTPSFGGAKIGIYMIEKDK
jgi:hypothetical protein